MLVMENYLFVLQKLNIVFQQIPSLKGAPIRSCSCQLEKLDFLLGQNLLLVVCGAIMTMPGLPRVPAADSIKLNKKGEIEGLF